MRKSYQRGEFLTGAPCPGEFVTSTRNALRKSIAQGDFLTADTGGSVQIRSRTADLPLDDAITRMTKAREMAGQLAAALRARH